MKRCRLVYALSLLSISSLASGQNHPDYESLIKGEWVVMESLQTSEIESPHTSAYFKYEFTDAGIVYVAGNQFERGKGEAYSISGDKLRMMGFTFTLSSYRGDQIEITTTTNIGSVVYNTTLVRKQKYDDLWKLGPLGKDQKKPPVFAGNFHLYDYVFSNFNSPKEYLKFLSRNAYPVEVIPPKNDVVIKINGVVNTNGDLSINRISTYPEMNAKKTERLRKRLANTSGYWRPSFVNGKESNDSVTLTIINRGKTSLQLKARAIQQFKTGYQHFQKGDYRAAILRCTDAISLDQTKFQFYVLRAVCHIKMSDIDKYCGDVRLANALNPFVSLENTEVVEGEALQIKCGERYQP